MANNVTAQDIEPFGDIAAAIEHMAWTHGITAEPEPVDAFVSDVNRLCDQDVKFDRIEMLLTKLQRARLLDAHRGVELHAAYLRQNSARQTQDNVSPEEDRPVASASMLASIADVERAAAQSLAQRRASGQITTYEADGWVVREYPGGRIERLARVGEFRVADHPYPGFTPPPSTR